jgi:hypothetical protein
VARLPGSDKLASRAPPSAPPSHGVQHRVLPGTCCSAGIDIACTALVAGDRHTAGQPRLPLHQLERECLKPGRASYRDPRMTRNGERVGKLSQVMSQLWLVATKVVQAADSRYLYRCGEHHTASRIPRPARLRLRLPPLSCGADSQLRLCCRKVDMAAA